MFVCSCVCMCCLSVCLIVVFVLFVCSCVCVVWLFACLFCLFCVFIYLFVCLPVCLFVCFSVYLLVSFCVFCDLDGFAGFSGQFARVWLFEFCSLLFVCLSADPCAGASVGSLALHPKGPKTRAEGGDKGGPRMNNWCYIYI